MALASRVGDSSRVTTEQPSGTVTLVFTDIEGSTKLLDALGPEEYQRALEVHREAVRGSFDRHGGYEVDTAGDGFFTAFSTASEAVRAVAEALAELESGPVRIRVGIHTGEPLLDPPKYVGLDVHRAARIMAAAHGGQALLSRTTRDLLGEGVDIRDLGEHRLKDLSAPQRLFQLGTREFPRPRTLHRTNLPVPATDFLGRARELDEVVERLANGGRLLTLTGPGGTGKTRLALQAAAEAADRFDDGVWWVPLAALRDPALVLRHTARTLDVVEQADRSLEDVLAEMLGGKRMLLLLDNAEHLLPDAAGSIAALRDLGGPKLVVTSRERLQLAGEHVYPVPQLTAPEGLGLFTARAAGIDPRFEAAPAVSELCDRLDNLPLAIELAAARTSVLTPEQILERLGDRFDLLKGGRDADPRQQTLRATIAWSYDLLADDERELFSRFAVFAGGATLGAIEEVCEADLEALASMVDKSLVRRDGDRYWMLETIREYGRDQLDEVSRADLASRHAEFYDGFTAEAELGLRGPDAAAWLDAVERELPNLRVALSWYLDTRAGEQALRMATRLGRYWEGRSAGTEGRGWLDRALALTERQGDARMQGLLWAGRLSFFQGRLEAARSHFAEAATLAERAGDDGLLAAMLAMVGWVATEQGDHEAAAPAIARSLELGAPTDDRWLRSEALFPFGACITYTVELDEGLAVNREIVELKRELDDTIGVADALNNVGWAEILRGDLDQAVAHLEEALGIARELGDTFRIELTLCNLGLTAVLMERYEEAAAMLDEALEVCIRRSDVRGGCETVLGLAGAHGGLGHDELAVQLDSISRAMMAGWSYPPSLLEKLGRPIDQARNRLGPGRRTALEAEVRPPTLESASALLDSVR
jgi:predicted ATPase/class 3 adenylate cyclase